jgi:hypothetical protein
MAQYLQSFIEFLEKHHHPDEVLRIKREVAPVYRPLRSSGARSGSVASRW